MQQIVGIVPQPQPLPSLPSAPKVNVVQEVLGPRTFAAAQKFVSEQKGWLGITTGLPGPNALLNNYGGTYVLYALMAAVVIGIIIVVVDAFHPFLPSIRGPTAKGHTFWKGQSGDTENLLVPESQSPTTRADTYSMTIQMIISDSRTPALGKYRHILHRGADPCSLGGSTATTSGHAGIKFADLTPSGEVTAYGADGLPQVMNPGLFLDKYKNDMHIFVHTRDVKGNMLLESTTVVDLPLNQPINIGLVCNVKTLEVYVNCRLYTTLLFAGTPYLPAHYNKWFGRYCAFPFMGSLSNLILWDTPLASLDIIRACRTASIANVPQPCPKPA